MRNYSWSLIILVLFLIVAGPVGTVHARSTYLTAFSNTYPTAPAVIKNCTLCHPGGVTTQFNPYATAYAAAGHLFAPIEPLDSDGDGFTNIVEINAGTYPGLASSHPVVDVTPPTVSISSPTALVYKINALNLGYAVSDGTVRVFVDGVQKTLVSGNRISGLANGSHIVRVTSTDAAGNVGSAQVSFTVNVEPILATSLADINGNGKAEIVALLRNYTSGGYFAYIKDGSTKALIGSINFGATYLPKGLCSLADLNANGKAEVAVLGKSATGSVAVVIKDSSTGVTLKTIPFASTYDPVAVAEVPDLNGNGKNELAVLAVGGTGGIMVTVKDLATGAIVKSVSFPSTYKALALAVVADVNGNSASELAVLGTTAGQTKVLVKDAFSGAVVNTVSYPATITPLALAATPDVSGNGAGELAVIGAYASGQLTAMLRDAFTGLAVKSLAITPMTSIPQGAMVVSDLNGNVSAELGVIGLSANGAVTVILKDTVSGLTIGNIPFPPRTM
jgi:hypothetical protein